MFTRIARIVGALAVAPALLSTAAHAGGCLAHECYTKVRTPDVYETVATPVVVAPARTEVVTTPAVLGTVSRQVEVQPARAWHSVSPALYGTVQREVVVQPGGWRWERKLDRHGRETMCKVYVAPVTTTVSERVVVEPARRVTHVAPAIYANQHRTIVLQPAAQHRVHHPAVVSYRQQNVLVKRGGWQWQRSW